MEDIDAAFTHGLTREPEQEEDANAKPPGRGGQSMLGMPPGMRAPVQSTTSKLSLSGLLNSLDGIGSQEGRILFATTNRVRFNLCGFLSIDV